MQLLKVFFLFFSEIQKNIVKGTYGFLLDFDNDINTTVFYE